MIDILDPSRLRQRTPHLQCQHARRKITTDRFSAAYTRAG